MDLYFSKGAGVRFRFPVTPRAVTVTTPGRDRAVNLADGREIMPLNGPGLREIGFEALLPNKNYHFAVYPDGVFRPARHFLDLLTQLKQDREPFILTLGGADRGQSLTVSLESLTVSEDASLGGDMMVAIRLREARGASLAVLDPEYPAPPAPPRDITAPVVPKTYTVVRGDTLWGIAKRFLGSGTRWPEVYALNRDKIVNPNLIYVGQVLTLP